MTVYYHNFLDQTMEGLNKTESEIRETKKNLYLTKEKLRKMLAEETMNTNNAREIIEIIEHVESFERRLREV